jgi:hypothetical protein
MKARTPMLDIALTLGIGLLLTGCSGTAPTPSTPATTVVPPTAATTQPAPASASATPSASNSASPTPTNTAPPGTLTLSGTAIGDRPLGSTPSSRLEPDLIARFGKPKVGRPELCHLVGQRNQFALVDHRFGGLTVHYARRGGATLAVGWQVALDRVPDGLRLADRLDWRPTFAALGAAYGVELDTADGVTVARLTGRAISYTGQAGADRPDTVIGGPDLICR